MTKLKAYLRSWRPAKGASRAERPVADPKSATKNAVLLVGQPGLGKTSMAHVLARECGYEPLEFNASDTRNKKSIEETIVSSGD